MRNTFYGSSASELRLERFCGCVENTLAKRGMPLNASEQDNPPLPTTLKRPQGLFFYAWMRTTQSKALSVVRRPANRR